MSYKIIRSYRDSYQKRTIATGLTLEEAQEHCRHPETSSSKCTGSEGRAHTAKHGPWFDGYEEENKKRSRYATGIFSALREIYPDRS